MLVPAAGSDSPLLRHPLRTWEPPASQGRLMAALRHTTVRRALTVLAGLASFPFREHPAPSFPRLFALPVASTCHSSPGLSPDWSLLIIHFPLLRRFSSAYTSQWLSSYPGDFLPNCGVHFPLLCLVDAPGGQGPSHFRHLRDLSTTGSQ